MSIYIFGKVVGVDESRSSLGTLRSIANKSGLALLTVDPGDKATLDDVVKEPGTSFAVGSSSADSDATALWLEATRAAITVGPGVAAAALAAASSSRLGRFCATLLMEPTFTCGGVALVDGGIEGVSVGTASECLAAITRNLLLPWDRSPNILYVWRGLATPSPDVR
jgi:hypothetical protein